MDPIVHRSLLALAVGLALILLGIALAPPAYPPLATPPPSPPRMRLRVRGRFVLSPCVHVHTLATMYTRRRLETTKPNTL